MRYQLNNGQKDKLSAGRIFQLWLFKLLLCAKQLLKEPTGSSLSCGDDISLTEEIALRNLWQARKLLSLKQEITQL